MAHPHTATPTSARERIRPGKSGSVISFYVLQKSTASAMSPQQVLQVIRRGLPIGELDSLQACLRMPLEGLAQKLGISRATLHRRRAEGRLTVEESDRVVRFARLFGQAVNALGSEDETREWLGSPQVGLGGAVPLEYATTEVGAREVEKLLGRIEYGVYA